MPRCTQCGRQMQLFRPNVENLWGPGSSTALPDVSPSATAIPSSPATATGTPTEGCIYYQCPNQECRRILIIPVKG
jgi:hypothetical protein